MKETLYLAGLASTFLILHIAACFHTKVKLAVVFFVLYLGTLSWFATSVYVRHRVQIQSPESDSN